MIIVASETDHPNLRVHFDSTPGSGGSTITSRRRGGMIRSGD